MHSQKSKGFALLPVILGLVAALVFAAGVARFRGRGNFNAVQAGYCAVSVAGAGILLLLADYTLHHARIVFLMVLLMIAALAVQSAAFCVGLGIALAGILVTQARG
ncbi:MAG TPA: hypothetical protein VLT16_15530 [Candidatus Limnocylindrales bacterium]|nr:hypothetical protein [Candidatus Limnocylindrales bacterium]